MIPPELPESWTEDRPAFSELSADLYQPFQVLKLRRARVAWLNEGWFRSRGYRVGTLEDRRRLEDWIVEQFAFGVPGEDDPADIFEDHGRTYWADRYGAPSGSMHGGSGRVGTLGRFNVKGVGRTPLVSESSDWYHSHGCMWLEEAVREAILASTSDAVFPHGAVPVIAVIDAGCTYRWRDGNHGARRALVVRPAFLRVASFMRSIFFGDSGTPDSAQVRDARRVRDLWQADWPQPGVAEMLARSFEATGRQYGWGRVSRLWPGPLFASNMTLTGELVDFGSFRAVADWSRIQGEARSHGFGTEEMLVADAARVLGRLALANDVALHASDLVERFRAGLRMGEAEALSAHGAEAGSPMAFRFANIVREQQRRTRGLGHRGVLDPMPEIPQSAHLQRERLHADTLEAIDRLDSNDLKPLAAFIDDRVAKTAIMARGFSDRADPLVVAPASPTYEAETTPSCRDGSIAGTRHRASSNP